MKLLLIKISILLLIVISCGSTNINQLNKVNDVIDCDTFDKSKIKLVTFDVFAALMDARTSLSRNIYNIASFLNDVQIKRIITYLIDGYAEYQGKEIPKQLTNGIEPFVWVNNKSLTTALVDMKLTDRIPLYSSTYNQLLTTMWAYEIPWSCATSTLMQLSNHYKIAPLSNGDNTTLAIAMSIFKPFNITPSYIFSSDYPVGAFKPNAKMYNQLLDTGYDTHEILHVAGAPNDGQGARMAGFFSALTWNEPSPGVQPCFLLKNITNILNILL